MKPCSSFFIAFLSEDSSLAENGDVIYSPTNCSRQAGRGVRIGPEEEEFASQLSSLLGFPIREIICDTRHVSDYM
ncbi:hypothetical protein CgunFtcFv8_017206 [Champsocephalus gunnari]|uniref:Uncharacterized protein n=1 Tax=Champsocephalus gunnari TaxID=52237 RepID=A0AAN8HR61_CHAGU|nr:hypothetical protein CgunFtcFv8_017206 [Champsocephalus gunnari]